MNIVVGSLSAEDRAGWILSWLPCSCAVGGVSTRYGDRNRCFLPGGGEKRVAEACLRRRSFADDLIVPCMSALLPPH